MPAADGNRTGGTSVTPTGEIATILTEKPRMVRGMTLDQIEVSARGVLYALEQDAYSVQRNYVRRSTEKEIRARLADLHECMTILAQLGWR